jgi:acetolactate synthase-1/2/3 large subunit
VPALEKALAINDKPVVIDFICDPEAMVFPMVVAGGSNDNVIMSPADLPDPAGPQPEDVI